MTRSILMATLFACALLHTACRNPGMPTLVASPSANTVASNDGQYTFYWVPKPNPVPLNRFFSMDVEVLDLYGNPVTPESASLTVDAGMPQHGHGMNHVPRINAQPDGTWMAEGFLMHMPGDWQLYFDLEVEGVSHRGQTPLVVD